MWSDFDVMIGLRALSSGEAREKAQKNLKP